MTCEESEVMCVCPWLNVCVSFVDISVCGHIVSSSSSPSGMKFTSTDRERERERERATEQEETENR